MKRRWILPFTLLLGGCLPAVPTPPTAQAPQVAPPALAAAPTLPRKKPARPAYSVRAEPRSPAQPEVVEQLEHLHVSDVAVYRGTQENWSLLEAEPVSDFPVVENEQVRYYIDYYTGDGREVLTRLLERADRYIPFMRQIFAEAGLPQDLSYLAMVESGFNPHAYSHAHAAGPWQFIESTGNTYGLNNNWWRDERRDFEKSTRAAARFLGDLYQRFEGDWYLAVAAYNAGGGRISRAMEENGAGDFWELSANSSLRDETKNYLPKLLAVLTIAKRPEAYGFTGIVGQPPLNYDVVRVPDATDLELVARLCEVSHDEIKALNPELKRWCTPPDVGSYELRIPPGKRELFEARYAAVPVDQRANYKRHRIAKGESLGAIAKKYNVRQGDLLVLNRLKDPRSLKVGGELLLPLHPSEQRLADERPAKGAPAKARTYAVQKGDTLWSIAKRFNASDKELRAWNGLGANSVLKPGQTLVVAKNAQTQAKPAAMAGAATPRGPRRIVYQVKSGDTLWNISRKYSISAKHIQAWNNLADNHILRPGETLTLMIHHEQS